MIVLSIPIYNNYRRIHDDCLEHDVAEPVIQVSTDGVIVTLWLTGIPIAATRHLFFKNPPNLPGFGPPPKPRPRPKRSRVGTIMILAIFTAIMLGILRLEAVGF